MNASTSPALAPRPTGRAALFAWLLPVVAVGAAMFVHWLGAVPPGPLPPPVVKDPPPAGKAAKTPAEPGDDDDDKEKDGFEPFTTPRADNLLVQLHEAYDKVAFKAEPTFEAWSVAHRPLITQIVTSARMQTFKGVIPSPSVSTANVECHTIRCRFTLSSPKQEDVQALLDTLAGLQIGGTSLWQQWKPDDIAEEPAKRAGGKPRMKSQVTVSFVHDLPKIESITLSTGQPLRTPPPTPVKSPTGPVPPSPSTANPSAVPPTGAPPTGATPGGAAPAGAAPIPSVPSTSPGRTTTTPATPLPQPADAPLREQTP